MMVPPSAAAVDGRVPSLYSRERERSLSSSARFLSRSSRFLQERRNEGPVLLYRLHYPLFQNALSYDVLSVSKFIMYHWPHFSDDKKKTIP